MRRYRTNVSESVRHWLTLRTELTDVTLVSEDTYWGLYWCNFGDWWYHNKEMKIGVIDMEDDKVADRVLKFPLKWWHMVEKF